MSDVHERIRDWWDRDAHTYDHSSSHSVSDPLEAAAWRGAMSRLLPPAPARVLDVGAGTGAMSLLAAELGHHVTALDLSPEMLARARAKAKDRDLDLNFVVGPAGDPPAGPFDAVMERHVLWTTPQPVPALRAWLEVAPGGRLVLFEGTWGSSGALHQLRARAADALRKAYRLADDHHAPYDPEILRELPLARLSSPVPIIRAVSDAGWRAARIHRLRDVEWARRAATRPLLGWLEHVPRYAVVADG